MQNEKKILQNGDAKHSVSADKIQRKTAIPGLIEDTSDDIFFTESAKENENNTSPGETNLPENRFNSDISLIKRFETDAELLQSAGTPFSGTRNFLVRPKSSGARLYNNKSGNLLQAAFRFFLTFYLSKPFETIYRVRSKGEEEEKKIQRKQQNRAKSFHGFDRIQRPDTESV